MRITHVFTNMNYVYTGALIKMFFNYITEIEQQFLICDIKDNVPREILDIDSKGKQIKVVDSLNLRKQASGMIQCLEKSDYVIFHFLPNNIYFHSMLLLKAHLYEKIIWRIWGADLYNWEKKKLKGLLFNSLRRHTRQKIKFIVSEPMDRSVFIDQFGDNVHFLDGPDPKGYDVEGLEATKTKKADDVVNVLLGHSAVKTLCHREILDKLSSYKDEKIRIILPLNYGDQEYAKEVYEYAISLFSENKIQVIKKKLNINEYMNCLWNCDIAIIHSDRQIAMGNITMMMYMQKKIFLKSGSIMDKYYRENQGLQVYDSNSVGRISFEEFIHSDTNSVNKDFAVREIDVSSIASAWKKTFSILEKEH